MKAIPNDVIVTIALALDLPEILNFCQTSKRINNVACNNEVFWINKAVRDYGSTYMNHINTKNNLPIKITGEEYYKFLKYDLLSVFDSDYSNPFPILRFTSEEFKDEINDMKMKLKIAIEFLRSFDDRSRGEGKKYAVRMLTKLKRRIAKYSSAYRIYIYKRFECKHWSGLSYEKTFESHIKQILELLTLANRLDVNTSLYIMLDKLANMYNSVCECDQ